MSLVHNTGVYQGTNKEANRKYSEFWVALALLCLAALTLVAAGAIFAPDRVGSGIRDDMSIAGP
jgi:hypothetical protein